MIPISVQQEHCAPPCSRRKNGGYCNSRGEEIEDMLPENLSIRADNLYRGDCYNQVEIAIPYPQDGNGLTDTPQSVGRNKARLEWGEPERGLAGIREVIMTHDLANLMPTNGGILEDFFQAGALTTNPDKLKSLSSSSLRASSVSSFSSLLTPGSRRPPWISIGADNHKKYSHCHLMGTQEGKVSCKGDDGDVNEEEGLGALMFSRGHLPQCPNSADASSAWFLERQQWSTMAADSFLYLTDLSSLSDEDGKEEENWNRMADEEQDKNASRGKKEKIESNLHLLGNSRHKSLKVRSEIGASAAEKTKEDARTMGRKKAPLAAPTDDCCNAPQYLSTFLHKTSLMENHGDRPPTRRAAMEHDPLVAEDANGSSSALTPSSTTCPNTFCATAAKATHQQKQHKKGSICHSSKQEVQCQNEYASFVRPCNKEEGRHHDCHHLEESTHESHVPVEYRRSQRILLASSKKSKLNKVSSSNHYMSSSFGGIPTIEDQERDHGHEMLPICPPPRKIIYGDTISLDKNHCARENATDEEEEKVQKIDQWYIQYQELVAYKKKHGHCNVPFRYNNENPFLAAWVKRQRFQYKCKIRGKRSHLTDERERLLEELGFVWDSHVAAWEENFSLMAEFYQQHGHCCVPIKQKELSDWAKRQRRLYRQSLRQAESSNTKSNNRRRRSTTISDDRIRRLNAIEFKWATPLPQHAKVHEASHKRRRRRARSMGSSSSTSCSIPSSSSRLTKTVKKY